MAASTSALPDLWKMPIRSRVSAGLRFSNVCPVEASTHSPSIKFLYTLMRVAVPMIVGPVKRSVAIKPPGMNAGEGCYLYATGQGTARQARRWAIEPRGPARLVRGPGKARQNLAHAARALTLESSSPDQASELHVPSLHLLHFEVGGPRFGRISHRVDRSQFDAIRTRVERSHRQLKAYGSHRTPGLIRGPGCDVYLFLTRLAIHHGEFDSDLRRIGPGQKRSINFCVNGRIVRFLESIRGRGNDLNALHHKRCPVSQQLRVESRRQIRNSLHLTAECNSTHAELLAVIGVDDQRQLQLAKTFIPRAEHNFERVLAGGNIELVLVVEWLLLEFLYFLLAVEIEIYGVAEACRNRSVGFVGDAEYVDRRMLLAFHFFKLHGIRRNADSKIHPGGVRRSVEEWRLHRARNISGHLAGCACFHLFFDRVSRKQVLGNLIAVSAASADLGSAALHLYPQCVTATFLRGRRRIAQDVILGLVVRDPLYAPEQIIGIHDDKTAGSLSQLVENLLVGSNIGKLGNDLPRLIVLIGPVHLAGIDHASSASSSAIATSTGSTRAAVTPTPATSSAGSAVSAATSATTTTAM